MKSIIIILIVVVLVFSGASFVMAQSLAERLSGKILIQVEQVGEAWYVDPVNLDRYFMGRPHDAFDLMRNLGLGITNEKLNQIPIGLISHSGALILPLK